MKKKTVCIMLFVSCILCVSVRADAVRDSSSTVSPDKAVQKDLLYKKFPTSAAPVNEKPLLTTAIVQSWWQHLILTIVTTFSAVAVPVLTTLLIVFIRRWNIKVEYDKAEWVARQGANYAEQIARNHLRGGQPLRGDKVLTIALEQSRKLATGTLAPWATNALQELIEAKLGDDNRDKPKPAPEGLRRDPTEPG